jgi:flagellar hook-length control protein FliK
MNATAPNLNPANAVQAPPAAGKPADPAAADTPFSQVLSGEIARKGGEIAEEAEPGTDAVVPQLTGSFDVAAELAPLTAAEVAREALDAQAAGTPPTLPETMLGFAIPAAWTKPAVAAPATNPAAQPADGLAVALDARSGRATAAPHDGEPAAATPDALQARPGPASQADAAAASPSAAPPAAAAFSEQLAAARQSDAAHAGERVAELMNHPGMRAAVHAAAAEAVPAPADAAASRLAPAVGTAAWGQALGDRLVWMAAGAQQTASLTLNPPNLGPLQVVLNVSNDQATASFYAVQPEVRQALESALPRLREMMTEAGIQLGQATVSADTPRQNDTPDRQAQRIAPEFPGAGQAGQAVPAGVAVSVPRAGRGLIDTFA